MTLSPWARCWSVVAALAMGLAVLEWSPLVAAVAFVAVLACVATVAALLPAHHSSTLVVALVAASWSIALVALVSSSPPLALLVVLLVVATSPPVFRLLRRRAAAPRPDAAGVPRPAAPPRGSPPAGQPGRDRAVEGLDDRQLCTLWRQLFWKLVDQDNTEGMVSTVAWRQACLDELERRDPAAVRAWLDSGARASGGPERFLTDHGRHGDADAG